MLEVSLNPFFWAVISLFGILGATAAVNTKYGRRFRWFGLTFSLLFTAGRLIMVLPVIPQPRLSPSPWLIGLGFSLGLISLIFILPIFKYQPLIFSQQRGKLRTRGLYAFVRHPFYLGELLMTASISIIFRSIIGLAFVPIWWAAFILHIIHEEERLEIEIGPFFLEYKKHVRGRIIPIPPFEFSLKIDEYPFTNLAFKGGGIKGVAYLGVIRALEEFHILPQIQRLVGSSAGAITATLISFNLDYETTHLLMDSLNYQMVPQLKSELDGYETAWLPRFIGKEVTKISADVEAVQRLITKYGWYSSEYFYNWMQKIIAQQCEGNGNATFADFHNRGFKDLYIVGTNASKLNTDLYSFQETPDMPVVDAVRISMSIPLYFESVQYKAGYYGSGDFHVDGGVLLNYPLHVFDNVTYTSKPIWFKSGINWETLGFYLYKNIDKTTQHREIQGLRDFISRLYEAYDISYQISQIDNNPIDRRRTVKIDTMNVQATDFYLKPEDKEYQDLVQSGYESTVQFLKNYQHPSFLINW